MHAIFCFVLRQNGIIAAEKEAAAAAVEQQ